MYRSFDDNDAGDESSYSEGAENSASDAELPARRITRWRLASCLGEGRRPWRQKRQVRLKRPLRRGSESSDEALLTLSVAAAS